MLPSLRQAPGLNAAAVVEPAVDAAQSSIDEPTTASAPSTAEAAAASVSTAAALSSCDGRCIAHGDLVIVYENPNSMKAVTVSTTGRFDSRFGSFVHKDWIGRPFGSRVFSRGSSGWCYLLAPTPELWTLVLKHRTQILYIADISVICMQLELRPGAVVLESGTGSASLTHSLGRAVAPGGHVFTYEFHSERSQEARKELQANGLGPVTTVTQRDIMELGFPLESHEGRVDAVFLDLPGPWKVVQNAAACLKPNGRFCSFSPCIEQVQRTCEVLRESGFTDIETIEVLLREYEVRVERMLVGVEDGSEQEQQQQQEGLVAAVDEAGPAVEDGAQGETAEGGVAAEGFGGVDAAGAGPGPAKIEGTELPPAAKRQKTGAAGGGKHPGQQKPKQKGAESEGYCFKSMVTSRPQVEARGHTGYLTFARKFV